jgi:hypothetical protein
VLLTGEGAAIADATGKQLGVDAVHAGLLPDDKVAQRQVMLTARSTVAMAGVARRSRPADGSGRGHWGHGTDLGEALYRPLTETAMLLLLSTPQPEAAP